MGVTKAMSLEEREMTKGEITPESRVKYLVSMFRGTKLIVCIYENRKYCFECFYTSEKASASSPHPCNVVPDITVCTFDNMRISFVMNIAFVLSPKDYIKVTHTPICVILLCLWRSVYHRLYSLCLYRGYLLQTLLSAAVLGLPSS